MKDLLTSYSKTFKHTNPEWSFANYKRSGSQEKGMP